MHLCQLKCSRFQLSQGSSFFWGLFLWDFTYLGAEGWSWSIAQRSSLLLMPLLISQFPSALPVSFLHFSRCQGLLPWVKVSQKDSRKQQKAKQGPPIAALIIAIAGLSFLNCKASKQKKGLEKKWLQTVRDLIHVQGSEVCTGKLRGFLHSPWPQDTQVESSKAKAFGVEVIKWPW